MSRQTMLMVGLLVAAPLLLGGWGKEGTPWPQRYHQFDGVSPSGWFCVKETAHKKRVRDRKTRDDNLADIPASETFYVAEPGQYLFDNESPAPCLGTLEPGLPEGVEVFLRTEDEEEIPFEIDLETGEGYFHEGEEENWARSGNSARRVLLRSAAGHLQVAGEFMSDHRQITLEIQHNPETGRVSVKATGTTLQAFCKAALLTSFAVFDPATGEGAVVSQELSFASVMDINFESVKDMKHLHVLSADDLQTGYIRNFAAIKHLESLKRLHLRAYDDGSSEDDESYREGPFHIESLEPLQSLKALEQLEIAGDFVFGDTSTLLTLPKLKDVGLLGIGEDPVDDEGLSWTSDSDASLEKTMSEWNARK